MDRGDEHISATKELWYQTHEKIFRIIKTHMLCMNKMINRNVQGK